MDEFLDFWESISNTALNAAKYQQAKVQADANREHEEKLVERRIEAQDIKDDLNFGISEAREVQRDNDTKIKDAINELETWNLNAESVIGLPKKYQTEDMRELMEAKGIQLNSDLTVGYNTRGTAREILNRMTFANEMQTDVINSIDGVLADVHTHLSFL
jgi:phosphoheptose isomerase